MKVKDLIERLRELNQDSEVILPIDNEGNGYNALGDFGYGIYYDDEMYSTEWSAEDCCLDDDEWAAMKETTPCIVLYPG